MGNLNRFVEVMKISPKAPGGKVDLWDIIQTWQQAKLSLWQRFVNWWRQK